MKIKFGAIVTDGRGKIGGHVASKNRAGAYLRTKVTPSNPNSTAQSQARGILASLSQNWSGLTDAQRKAWNSAVSDWSSTDIFGDSKNPTGLNLYVKVNSNLANAGYTGVVSPPLKLEMPTVYALSGTLSVATGNVVITMSDGSADGTPVLVRATPKLSPGVSFVKSELRVIGYADSTAGLVTISGAYIAKYGTPVLGSNIFASAQLVLASGQKSIDTKVKLTVIA